MLGLFAFPFSPFSFFPLHTCRAFGRTTPTERESSPMRLAGEVEVRRQDRHQHQGRGGDVAPVPAASGLEPVLVGHRAVGQAR